MIPLATLGFKLLGIGRWIWSAILAGIKWALSDWRHILIAIVSLFAAYQWVEAGKYQRAHGKAVASLERANKTIADMTAASEAAKAAQIAMNETVKVEYETKARQSNEKHKANLVAIRSAANDYATGNRLSKVCPNFTTSSDTTTKDSATQGDGGLSGDAVILARGDYDRLNVLAAERQRDAEWARGLIAKGLAVQGE